MVEKENSFLMQLTIHCSNIWTIPIKTSLILGDFNCTIQKSLDRNPPQQLDDMSVREFQSMLHRNDLFDVWRKLNPETKRYTFKCGKSKSRIDYILCSNAVSSKVFGTQINHFPFSDHDIIITPVSVRLSPASL